MAKRKSNAPNIPAQSLARARAELQGGVGTLESALPMNGAEAAVAARPALKANPTTKGGGYRVVTVDDLKNEYVYVISDIRNMALLAGFLFVVMIVVAVVFI